MDFVLSANYRRPRHQIFRSQTKKFKPKKISYEYVIKLVLHYERHSKYCVYFNRCDKIQYRKTLLHVPIHIEINVEAGKNEEVC